MTTATSVKLDEATKERVRKIAAERHRSPHWIMKEAITQYIEEADWRAELHRAGNAAWADYQSNGLHLTQEEMEVWFARIAAGEDVPPPECHV